LRALLLAAGLGTRLRPITDKIPKCLVPVHGRPLLSYWFDMLFTDGVESALVNTHYHAGAVNAFVAESPWCDRVELVYEKQLLGTGGTVLRNREWFAREAFMVVHADNLSRFPVREFIAAHRNRPAVAAMTMMTFDTDAPQTCGIVELDTHGLVQRFHEKVANPPGTRANGAVYIIEPEIVDFIGDLGREFVDLSNDVIPHFLGRIATYHNTGYHRDIGTVESLRKAEAGFPAT
jgi:mannose-1-phosphate guanylyltransferase